MARRARNATGELLEEPWQAQVLGLAGHYGWLAYHTHDSRRSQRGFPDLVLVRDLELLIVELKTATGRTSPEQRAWLEALDRIALACTVALDELEGPVDVDGTPASAVAVEVHLWRPADFEVVHNRLARGRVRQEPLGV